MGEKNLMMPNDESDPSGYNKENFLFTLAKSSENQIFKCGRNTYLNKVYAKYEFTFL